MFSIDFLGKHVVCFGHCGRFVEALDGPLVMVCLRGFSQNMDVDLVQSNIWNYKTNQKVKPTKNIGDNGRVCLQRGGC